MAENWTKKSGDEYETVDGERAGDYDKSKAEFLPVHERHGQTGQVIAPLEPQPVFSPGIYEADFVVKGDDLLFHIQPEGWAKAIERAHELKKNPVFPSFKPGFNEAVHLAMKGQFDQNRVEIILDEEIHSYFARATGYSKNQFHREMAIKMFEDLHLRMGGAVEG